MSIVRTAESRPESLLRGVSRGALLIRRGAIFYSAAARMAAGYWRVQRAAKRLPAEEADKLWHEQHRRRALLVADTATRLRGMLIKTGQYLSARPDVLPEEYIEALAGLQDRVPPRPYSEIERQVRREFGAPVGELFASFSRKPVASASLAQVHRARTHDGRDVAVKVLYPDIEPIVRMDVWSLGVMVGIVGRIWPKYDFRVIYNEARRLVPLELDLQHEAQNLTRIASDLAHRHDVVIPALVPELCSRRVLTMQFIDGIKVNDVQALRDAGLDPPAIGERIVDIFGDQVLEHGFFHGDPHPGNIFVLRDGRVALIDFGQALSLADGPRQGFALLSSSAQKRNPAGMIQAVQLIGIRLPSHDMAAYLRMASQTLGIATNEASDTEDEGAAVNVRMARGFRGISLDGISGEALFVFRGQGLLRGLRARLGSPGTVVISWHKFADALLAEHPVDDEAASA
ncbi:MAG: ABC1 kinase family protein, partial [Dehalococcoidia bacterium]